MSSVLLYESCSLFSIGIKIYESPNNTFPHWARSLLHKKCWIVESILLWKTLSNRGTPYERQHKPIMVWWATMHHESLLSTVYVGVTHEPKRDLQILDWVNVTIKCYYAALVDIPLAAHFSRPKQLTKGTASPELVRALLPFHLIQAKVWQKPIKFTPFSAYTIRNLTTIPLHEERWSAEMVKLANFLPIP